MIIRGIFLLLLLSLELYAQNTRIQHYNVNDGLSHNSVRHILQDNTGFLWMGTFRGLNRFDGHRFKKYLSTNYPINHDDITALLFDSLENKLWFGTRKGLSYYDITIQKFKTYLNDSNNPNSLPQNEIRSIYKDEFNRLWIGTRGNGLVVLDLENENFKPVPLEGFKYVKAIYGDKKGFIWIGSFQERGIAKISLDSRGEITEIKTFQLKVPSTGEVNPYINFFYEDHKADLFVGTRGGLFKKDTKSDVFRHLSIEDPKLRKIIGPYFNCVTRAPDGKYWLGTIGGILVCNKLEEIAKGKVKRYHSMSTSNDYSLIDNMVSELYFDKSGMLWIGTENGLDKINPFENQFKYYNNLSSVPIDNNARVNGFAEASDKTLLIAQRNTGIIAFKNGKSKLLNTNYNNLSSIHTFDGRIFYCGLWDGNILIYDYTSNTTRLLETGFNNVPIFSFCKLPNNQILASSFGQGHIEIDADSYEIKKTALKLSKVKRVHKAILDKNDNLWIASSDGISKYDFETGKEKNYSRSVDNIKTTLNTQISDLVLDKHGNLWATARTGVFKFNDQTDTFSLFSDSMNLGKRWVTDIIATNNGSLWMNLNSNEIAEYEIINNRLIKYYVNSGIKLDVFSFNGFYLNSNKDIFMASKDGMITFSSDSLLINKSSPAPFISEVSVNNNEIKVGKEFNGHVILEKDINASKSLVLDYSNRNFSFKVSSPSYSKRRKNTVLYKLEGHDPDWNEADMAGHRLQYSNIFFGDYTFKIKAANSAGIWSDVNAYRVKILPPFWLKTKAIIAYIVLLALMVYLVVSIMKRKRQAREALLLEKVRREKDELLVQEKLRFFTDISHELRTPLSLIIGPTKQLLEDSFRMDHQEPKLELIYQNANRLLSLVNQVMDFRKAEAGDIKLKVCKTEITFHTFEIFKIFSSLAEDKKISLNFINEYEKIQGWIDIDKFDKILYNLLSNAIKYTPRNGQIDLYVGLEETKNKNLVIEVSDNGIGIAEDQQKKVFSRFYQVSNEVEESSTGTGIGLSLVKSLVELHKAKISLKSKLGEGSIFRIVVPIHKQAYEETEIFERETIGQKAPDKTSNTEKTLVKPSNLLHEILIIEDNSELRSFLADYLSDFFKVKVAKNGIEGLEICKKSPPMICVSDVMMPEMDGFEFCERLKNDDSTSHIAVILLTALSEVDNKINGYKLGADDYLVKPFEPSLLKTRIENIIRTREEIKRKFSGSTDAEVSSITHSPADEEFINEMVSVIEENINNPKLSSSFLCTKMGVSSTKLYRKTKDLTDMGTNEFIKIIKLKKAVPLLKSRKHNIAEVSYMVGFNDPLYFSKCFKQQFDFSPSKLTKQQKV